MDARSTKTPDELTRFDKQEGRSQSLASLPATSFPWGEKWMSDERTPKDVCGEASP